MHFIVLDICNQNACLIYDTLQWFKYSTAPNDVSLYTEMSQTFKHDLNPILSFVFHNDWLQIHCWILFKRTTPNFVPNNVLLPISCHLGSCMPNLRILVEDIVALLGEMTNKWLTVVKIRQ